MPSQAKSVPCAETIHKVMVSRHSKQSMCKLFYPINKKEEFSIVRWIKFKDRYENLRRIKIHPLPNHIYSDQEHQNLPLLLLDELTFLNAFGPAYAMPPITSTAISILGEQSCDFETATHAALSIVFDLYYLEYPRDVFMALCKDALRRALQVPILVCRNDLIQIDSLLDPMFKLPLPRLYFSINELSCDREDLIQYLPKQLIANQVLLNASSTLDISLSLKICSIPSPFGVPKPQISSCVEYKGLHDLISWSIQSDHTAAFIFGLLVCGPQGVGKRWIIERVLANLSIPYLDYYQLKFKHIQDALAACVYHSTILAILMEHIENFEQSDFELLQRTDKFIRAKGAKLLLIGTTADRQQLSTIVLDHFIYSVTINKLPYDNEPNEQAIDLLLPKDTTPSAAKYIVERIKTASLNIKDSTDLKDLISESKLFGPSQHRFDTSLSSKVYWDDIGGLYDAKELLQEHIQNFTKLFRKYGILFYGPPGTGKTFLAKAVATEYDRSFFSIKGPELLSMYVGETEANIRNIFKQARNSSPAVLFFDEFDSLAVSRGKDGDSSGIADRIVAQLITEFDLTYNVPENWDVLVLAATNRPDLLDEAIIRAGRFEKCIRFDMPNTIALRVDILQRACAKFLLSKDIDLEAIAKACPTNITPADLAGLARQAARMALRKFMKEFVVDPTIPITQVELTTSDFYSALETKLGKSSM